MLESENLAGIPLEVMAAKTVEFLKCDPMLQPYLESLDFSPASLSALDESFSDWYGPEVYPELGPDKPFPERLNGVVMHYGIYLAEVLRRAVGGFWHVSKQNFFQSSILTPGGEAIFPFICVQHRLALGTPLASVLKPCDDKPCEKTAERVDFLRQMAEHTSVPGPGQISQTRLESAQRAAIFTGEQIKNVAAQSQARRRRKRAIYGLIAILLAGGALFFGYKFFMKVGFVGMLILAYLFFS